MDLNWFDWIWMQGKAGGQMSWEGSAIIYFINRCPIICGYSWNIRLMFAQVNTLFCILSTRIERRHLFDSLGWETRSIIKVTLFKLITSINNEHACMHHLRGIKRLEWVAPIPEKNVDYWNDHIFHGYMSPETSQTSRGRYLSENGAVSGNTDHRKQSIKGAPGRPCLTGL